jgi:hypothetical protein
MCTGWSYYISNKYVSIFFQRSIKTKNRRMQYSYHYNSGLSVIDEQLYSQIKNLAKEKEKERENNTFIYL